MTLQGFEVQRATLYQILFRHVPTTMHIWRVAKQLLSFSWLLRVYLFCFDSVMSNKIYIICSDRTCIFRFKNHWCKTIFKKFPGGREPLPALQHGKFLNGNVSLPNVTPVRILRRYMLCGLVPAEMEVRVVSWNFAGQCRAYLQTFRVATRDTV